MESSALRNTISFLSITQNDPKLRSHLYTTQNYLQTTIIVRF